MHPISVNSAAVRSQNDTAAALSVGSTFAPNAYFCHGYRSERTGRWRWHGCCSSDLPTAKESATRTDRKGTSSCESRSRSNQLPSADTRISSTPGLPPYGSRRVNRPTSNSRSGWISNWNLLKRNSEPTRRGTRSSRPLDGSSTRLRGFLFPRGSR